MPNFYEFFAGGGMARAGLSHDWKCLFANDFDHKKGITYQTNWGYGGELTVGDVNTIKAEDLPGHADLVWGSFPCQDLSLAGNGSGLNGSRSGTFYPFWKIITDLVYSDRAPKIVALENVLGTLTSRGGKDFDAICQALAKTNFRYGALAINASLFVPQSRPRLFLVGVREDIAIPPTLLTPKPLGPFHTKSLCNAVDEISHEAKKKLVWWNVPTPALRTSSFADIIEENPSDVAWHSAAETKRLLNMMSPINLAKLNVAKQAQRRMVGTIYKRTRFDEDGSKVQRAEVRFDDVAGCLRTPAGGSSRQTIIVIDGKTVRTRLISARETARLMGLEDAYVLPKTYNEAYHLTGDGVVVPVVRHLAHHVFEPILGASFFKR